jgi:hypothetical protein
MTLNKRVYSALVILLFSVVVCRAQASTAVYEHFQFSSGEFHFNDVEAFSVAAPGLYEAQLFDYHIPAAFSQLSLVITQDSTVLGGAFGTSAFTFNIFDETVPLSVHVSGVGPDAGPGLWGMQVLPIPVPPAFWLFLSGMAGIIGVARRGFRSDAV